MNKIVVLICSALLVFALCFTLSTCVKNGEDDNEPPVENPGDNPNEPESPADPETPENPENPENPTDPETPETPTDPENPTNPDEDDDQMSDDTWSDF